MSSLDTADLTRGRNDAAQPVDRPPAAVVGAGVIGLTTAIRLLERGFPVTILSRESLQTTTSYVAAAYWHPFAALPRDRVLPWARATYKACTELARDPSSGVVFKTLYKLFIENEVETWWMEPARDRRRLAPDEHPWPYHDGYALSVPLMETVRFLPYLRKRARALGATFQRRDVQDLSGLYERYEVIVNCTGVWAGELAGDASVEPIRGQVLRVKLPPDMDRSIISFDQGDTKCYIVPRSEDCILGGTAEHGSWDTVPDEEVAQEILERCARLRPELRRAEWLDHHVGLRPGRPKVRVERDAAIDQAIVLHNYGHGGAGYTLSWGCAEEIAALAEESVESSHLASVG